MSSTGEISAPMGARSSGASYAVTRDPRRLAPRRPRAALEPERVPVPTKWSKSARHPMVIAGNAVFTLLIMVAVLLGVGFAVGKHRFDTHGPLPAAKGVKISPPPGPPATTAL